MSEPGAGSPKPSIGFIGMGHMGSHMTRRLIAAGYPLTVFDRTEERVREAETGGAKSASTARALAENSQVILVSVTDDDAQWAVMYGPDGALAGTQSGSLIIDVSTVSPAASRRLYQAALERGAQMIDAAVSGSVPQVDQGSLVVFVGGDEGAFRRSKPILDVLGSNVFYIGASGMGTTMKLVVNTLLGLGMQSLAEALTLGQNAGISTELMLDVLGQTYVLSPSQRSKFDNVRADQYPTSFSLALMHKDLDLVLREAYAVSAPMPATAAAQQMFAAATAAGMEGDLSLVIKFMRELARPPTK